MDQVIQRMAHALDKPTFYRGHNRWVPDKEKAHVFKTEPRLKRMIKLLGESFGCRGYQLSSTDAVKKP